MRRYLPIVALVAALGACRAPSRQTTGSPKTQSGAALLSSVCAGPEYRQFDFWIGEWDLRIRTRKALGSAEWDEAAGTQRVETILSGCAIAEHFRGDGPGAPWAGESYSAWQPALHKWRQTWVDDQGGFLAFVGSVDEGVMTLRGEPTTTPKGATIHMRMVFLDVTPSALRWEWQRSVDDGASWDAQMIIHYRRRTPTTP